MSTQTAGIIPVWTTGERLKKARETAGYEQEEFANKIGISRSTVSNYERDVSRPKRIAFNAWALATGVPVEWLETGNAPQPSGPGGETVERTRRDSNPKPSDPKVRGYRRLAPVA